MDEYGCFLDTAEDWDVLAGHASKVQAFTFTYCADGVTSYIVTIAHSKNVGGPLPWGGSITGLHMVAVRRFGAEFFDLRGDREFQPGYIGEKLGLGGGDSIHISALLNELRKRLRGQA